MAALEPSNMENHAMVRVGTDGSLLKHTFKGANDEYEIESYDEFVWKVQCKVRQGAQEQDINFSGWTFQQVDFSAMPLEQWQKYKFKGAAFWGCVLPDGITKDALELAGASVFLEPEGLPFRAIRAFMYRQEELQERDLDAYNFYLQRRDVRSLLMTTLHDYFISDALYDFLEGKTVVVVMGGHGNRRSSTSYADVAALGYKLARAGFLVATGGGPGLMEAANLGAYMAAHSEEDLRDAIHIIATEGDHSSPLEQFDTEAPKAVIRKYGWPTWMPSLGVPTWKYGHEPPNLFATWQAKMFSNAIREDGLIDIGNGGIIYSPGSAGTRQEVFQTACKNHYAVEGEEVPMIFYGTQFWSESLVYDCLECNSKDRPMARWLAMMDDVDEVVGLLKAYRKEYKLPKVSLDELEAEHKTRYAAATKYPKPAFTGEAAAAAKAAEMASATEQLNVEVTSQGMKPPGLEPPDIVKDKERRRSAHTDKIKAINRRQSQFDLIQQLGSVS